MENITLDWAATQAACPKNPVSSRPSRRKPKDQLLTIPDPAVLERHWREWDDLPERVPLNGFPAELIAQLGYKFCRSGNKYTFAIPRNSAVISVRNGWGRIVALHGPYEKWFTAPQPHFANLSRVNFTHEIEVHGDTITADVESLRRNVACVGLNGLTYHDLQLTTAYLSVKLVRAQVWRVAA